MKLVNKTKTISDNKLQKLIDFCNKDLNVNVPTIEIGKCKTNLFNGGYYHYQKKQNQHKNKIKINVNFNKIHYPTYLDYEHKTKLKYYNGYLNYWLLSPSETIIHVLSHELRHIWQEQNRKNRDKWIYSSYGKYSNKDADSYAIHKQREFRKLLKSHNYFYETHSLYVCDYTV